MATHGQKNCGLLGRVVKRLFVFDIQGVGGGGGYQNFTVHNDSNLPDCYLDYHKYLMGIPVNRLALGDSGRMFHK